MLDNNIRICDENDDQFCCSQAQDADKWDSNLDDNGTASLLAEMGRQTCRKRLLKNISAYSGRLKTRIADAVSRILQKLQTGIGKMLDFLRNLHISARGSRLGQFCSNVSDIVMSAQEAYTALNNFIAACQRCRLAARRCHEFFDNA
jgi:hypothetical protein